MTSILTDAQSAPVEVGMRETAEEYFEVANYCGDCQRSSVSRAWKSGVSGRIQFACLFDAVGVDGLVHGVRRGGCVLAEIRLPEVFNGPGTRKPSPF